MLGCARQPRESTRMTDLHFLLQSLVNVVHVRFYFNVICKKKIKFDQFGRQSNNVM